VPCRTFPDQAIRTSIKLALKNAGLAASEIGHVNAHGLSTQGSDQAEAQAIREMLGDVPVTALKSYFGNLGAGSGAVELLGTLAAFESGRIPPTLNYERPDPACPVNVVAGQPLSGQPATALVLNQTLMGQSVALALSGE
jgi:3-oxoacyl-[acyl-carrier-protein] synthase II